MATLAQVVPEKNVLEDAVRSIKPPKGLAFDRVVLDSDHSGDPAIRILFNLTKRLPLTATRINALADFRLAVRDAVWDLNTGWIPYVAFNEKMEDEAR